MVQYLNSSNCQHRSLKVTAPKGRTARFIERLAAHQFEGLVYRPPDCEDR